MLRNRNYFFTVPVPTFDKSIESTVFKNILEKKSCLFTCSKFFYKEKTDNFHQNLLYNVNEKILNEGSQIHNFLQCLWELL